MYVLGVAATENDAAVCLLRDGAIVFCAEEERFSRIKHKGWKPERALDFCFEYSGVDWKDIDQVGYSWQPFPFLWKSAAWNLSRIATYPVQKSEDTAQTAVFASRHWRMLHYLKRTVGYDRVHAIDHHLTHAASAFLVSPYEEASILTLDARGEWTTTLLGIGRGTTIKVLDTISVPHSLGYLYGAFTYYLGFESHDEYKVMGLAAYGKPSYLREFREIIQLCDGGKFRLNKRYVKFFAPLDFRGIESLLGQRRLPGEELTERHRDIAASLQKVLEEAAVHITDHLHRITKQTKLCIAGGVGLNGVMNARIQTETPFKEVFVQPAASDDGTALGSAVYVYNVLLGQPRNFVMDRADLGPEYSNEQIKDVLDKCMIRYEYHENIAPIVARLITKGFIVGWFQGRMEYGPRALGNRSILADPRRAEMKDIVNRAVKYREEFRPFAPSVLEEDAHEYFEMDGAAPFMLKVFPVRPEKQNIIPAVTHVDGTGRVQTVSQKTNPLYWQVIGEFKRLTGVSVILNTSFNVKGEPIVCSPTDALRCFYGTGLHALAIGNFLILKEWREKQIQEQDYAR